MLIKRSEEAQEIVANDGCRLRELLHPDHDPTSIRYSLALAWVEPGGATLPHRLSAETEVYLILAGRGRMHIDGDVAEVATGDAIVIPAAAEQWIECVGDVPLHFAAIVDPPWRADHDVRSRGGGTPPPLEG